MSRYINFPCLFVTEEIHSIFTGSSLCAVIHEVFLSFFFCEINARSFNLKFGKISFYIPINLYKS